MHEDLVCARRDTLTHKVCTPEVGPPDRLRNSGLRSPIPLALKCSPKSEWTGGDESIPWKITF
jgi:hypothetical protein